MTQLLQLVDNHLAPLDPVVLSHHIKLSGHADTEFYDLLVDIDDPSLGDTYNQFMTSLAPEQQREIVQLDQKVGLLVACI